MSGSIIGGKKASRTNRERYGEDFYKKIGAIGGRNGHTGGFMSNPALAALAGRKGGMRGKRGLKFLREEDDYYVYEDRKTKAEVWYNIKEEKNV